ncbi:hypothetical protein J6590_025319 [Homalodisca vitripennis]|nr:hypothetical protein J6590_025319 [Homalodisca vitripennis]
MIWDLITRPSKYEIGIGTHGTWALHNAQVYQSETRAAQPWLAEAVAGRGVKRKDRFLAAIGNHDAFWEFHSDVNEREIRTAFWKRHEFFTNMIVLLSYTVHLFRLAKTTVHVTSVTRSSSKSLRGFITLLRLRKVRNGLSLNHSAMLPTANCCVSAISGKHCKKLFY